MKLRSFITLLLMMTVAVTAMGALPQTPVDKAAAETDAKLTPEEEREARDIAALFTKRWRETEDIGPLIDEFFVPDFADRLRHEPQMLYFAELKPELLVPENRDDLRRHYVAMLNFVRLILRLNEVYETTRLPEQEDDGPELYTVLPAEIWNVLKSNPALNALLAEEMGERARGQSGGVDEDSDKIEEAKTIKTIEELRSMNATLERAILLLRAHLKTLPTTLPTEERISSGEDSRPADAGPRLTVIGEEFYGYPAGTRLVSFYVLLFRVDLVRVGPRLKVLSVYLHVD